MNELLLTRTDPLRRAASFLQPTFRRQPWQPSEALPWQLSQISIAMGHDATAARMNASMLETVSANSGERALELSKSFAAADGVFTALASGSVARPPVVLKSTSVKRPAPRAFTPVRTAS